MKKFIAFLILNILKSLFNTLGKLNNKEGVLLEKIINEAKRLRIGNLQSPLLARALYYTGEIGDEVMSKLYNAVAIALAYIYKINNGESIEKPEIDVPDELIFDEYGNQNDK